MQYLYGEFSDKQIDEAVKQMHKDIHKLLLYKAEDVTTKIFKSDEEFLKFFSNTLFRFGGLNELLGEPPTMVSLMSTLQAAYDLVKSDSYQFKKYRRAILDCHGYIASMFEGELICHP